MNEEQLREAYPFLYAKQKNREQANELIDKGFFRKQFKEVNKGFLLMLTTRSTLIIMMVLRRMIKAQEISSCRLEERP